MQVLIVEDESRCVHFASRGKSRKAICSNTLCRITAAVVSRETLTRDVWRENLRYTSLDNVIDVQIARLCRKIEDSFDTIFLRTVRAAGFAFQGD